MKKTTQFLPLAAIAGLVLALAPAAQAAIIAEYTFTSGSTASTGPLGSSIGGEAGDTSSDDFRVNGDQVGGGANGGTVYTDVDQIRINNANWVTFTIAVPDTQEIGLTSLDFDYTKIYPTSFLFGVYTSKTGFTEGAHLLGLFHAGTDSGTFTEHNGTSVDLSGITALQGLTDETVEFRFLLGDDTGLNTRFHVLDNIGLVGDITAVPEPATMSLLAIAGIALIRRRRRA